MRTICEQVEEHIEHIRRNVLNRFVLLNFHREHNFQPMRIKFFHSLQFIL